MGRTNSQKGTSQAEITIRCCSDIVRALLEAHHEGRILSMTISGHKLLSHSFVSRSFLQAVTST